MATAQVREQDYLEYEAEVSLGIASNMLYRWKGESAMNIEGKSFLTYEWEDLNNLTASAVTSM